MSILQKLFQKIHKEETLSNSSQDANITMIPEPDKIKLQTTFPHQHRHKKILKDISKLKLTI